jgi:hypothetical protein
VGGEIEALVALNRATPGAPYGAEDVEFADELACALRLALRRVDAYRTGWRRRSELVDAIATRLARGERTDNVEQLLHDDRVEVVFDLGTPGSAYAASAFANGQTDAVVEELRSATLLGIDDRVRRGDLEFLDLEQDLESFGGAPQPFLVHRGLVRDVAARPRALVVVAQPAPRAFDERVALPRAS